MYEEQRISERSHNGGRCGVVYRATAGFYPDHWATSCSLALSPPSSLWSLPPHLPRPPAALCSLTWQNDIGETQLACERQGPVEHRLVLPPDLFQLTSQQLQGNDESWGIGGGGQATKKEEQRSIYRTLVRGWRRRRARGGTTIWNYATRQRKCRQ